MATITVQVIPSFEGASGKQCETIRGWEAVGRDRDTGATKFRKSCSRKRDAWDYARGYCRRHGHGMLNPGSR